MELAYYYMMKHVKACVTAWNDIYQSQGAR